MKTTNCVCYSYSKSKIKLPVWPSRLLPRQLLLPFSLGLSPPAIRPLSVPFKLLFLLAIEPLPRCFHLEVLPRLSLSDELLLVFHVLAQFSVLSRKLSPYSELGQVSSYWTTYFSFVVHTYNCMFIHTIIALLPFSHLIISSMRSRTMNALLTKSHQQLVHT